MKKSERIKILEEKVEELSRTNHAMEMKLFVAMDKLDGLRKDLSSIRIDLSILQSEVNHEE